MGMTMELELAWIAIRHGDHAEGVVIISRLAGQGHVKAQMHLGVIYADGLFSVSADQEKAFYWFKKAAENGSPEGQYALAQMYDNGWGTAVDLGSAFANYRLAAGGGHQAAQLAYALAYWEGMGVDRDPRQCLRLLDQYCDEGNPKTQVALGKLYYGGESLLRADAHKAFSYFVNAALRGDTEGDYLAAYLMLHQATIKKNLTTAYVHLARAASARVGGALELLQEITPKMTDGELEEAKGRVLDFKPRFLSEPMFVLGDFDWFV
jgi:hypothetical protein